VRENERERERDNGKHFPCGAFSNTEINYREFPFDRSELPSDKRGEGMGSGSCALNGVNELFFNLKLFPFRLVHQLGMDGLPLRLLLMELYLIDRPMIAPCRLGPFSNSFKMGLRNY